MDRRDFLQAGSALALGLSPLSTIFSQTTWSPPYPLPAPGEVIPLTAVGGNTLDDVATGANGWGEYTSSLERASPIYCGYGFGAFAADYGTAGAMVIAGVGGHHAGGIWGGFIFDFTTGKWVSRANANGKTETDADPPVALVDWSTGELRDQTGLSGQLPIPGHGYLWHFCPPKSVGGGTKGHLIKCCVAAGSDAGYDAARSFKFDLDTGLWTYASDNNINFDGQYLNPYTDGGGDWDPVTNRFYTPQKGAYTGALRYLDKTATGWTWRKVGCPNLRNATLATAFVHGRQLVLGYRDFTWQRVDLDNIGAGASYFTMVNASSYPTGYIRWHYYPVDGCWYALTGKANRAGITTWPSAGSPPNTQAADQFLLKIDPTTWTISQVPIAGGIIALWENRYSATPPHGNAFVYVPQLQCFAWFPRHDAPAQLIKPPGTASSDTQPPSVPFNLRVTAASASSITWAWDASTDFGGGAVAGYKVAVYDNADVPLGGTVDVGSVLTYTATSLNANTTIKLRVSAYDTASPVNESSQCAAVAGTTTSGADTQPPTVPANLRVTATSSSSITWEWSASTDNGGGSVAGYRVGLYDGNDAQIGAFVDMGNALTCTRSGLNAASTYKLRVSAYDNATPANESALCAAVAGTTAAGSADTQPPTVPTNLRVTATSSTSVTWEWSASTDNGGGSVAGYRVALFDEADVQIGALADVGVALVYTRTGLNAGTTYKLRVSAYDNAIPANESVPCAPVAGTTMGGGDTQPPTIPAALRVSATTPSSITWEWSASTDNGGGSLAGYRVAFFDRNGIQIGSFVDVSNALTYTRQDLRANTTYMLRVSAYDNATPRNESGFCPAVAGITNKKPTGKDR